MPCKAFIRLARGIALRDWLAIIEGIAPHAATYIQN